MGTSTRGLSARGLGKRNSRWARSAGIFPAAGRELVSLVSDVNGGMGQALSKFFAIGCVAAGAFALGGCGMSSLTSGLGTSVFGNSSSASKSDVKTVSEDQLLSAAKAGDGTAPAAISADAGGCPRFVVGQRDNNLTIYEAGRAGDGLAIMHRGEITKTGRECQVEPGKVVVRYGFAGRVLLGPKGKTGNIKLPVTITVTDAKREKIATDTVKIDVDVAVDKPIGYFSAVKAITIPIPEGSRPGEFEILVGFDRAVPGAG
jgi:hypothetical protein